MSTAANVGESGLATPPTTPPVLTRAQKLDNVITLATQFSTCVEAFNLIHPSKDSDHSQRVALAKLGIQQGRLLIFGDAIGISSPPKTVAKHMIPSHPGATNPDPHLPVNFGVRDEKLDDPDINEHVRSALNEIAGRPALVSREELMEKYGLKAPKSFKLIEYPALDTNRLEAFREKYALLQDLARQVGTKTAAKRSMSMTMQHWTVKDTFKFDCFVTTVRNEVDGLIDLMGVKEQVDRGMRTDIRTMGWHPDLRGPVVKQDWEKLRLIREACVDDYPEYALVTDTALKYISEELKDTALASWRDQFEQREQKDVNVRRKSQDMGSTNGAKTPDREGRREKEKRPGWLSAFKFKSWHKSSSKDRSKNNSLLSPGPDPPRSLSESAPKPEPLRVSEDANALEPVRSKSLSAIPDQPAPLDLATRLEKSEEIPEEPATVDPETRENIPTIRVEDDSEKKHPAGPDGLQPASTVNSLIDRHDMWKGEGRVETKDIREKAHDWASGG